MLHKIQVQFNSILFLRIDQEVQVYLLYLEMNYNFRVSLDESENVTFF